MSFLSVLFLAAILSAANTDLITIDVIVLDKDGQPVRNLGKDNFRLFEDGKERQITSFQEISAATPAGNPDRGKIVLILFDDSHLSGSQLKITRDSAEAYVNEFARPQDLFAVASYSGSLKVLQSFTNDRAKIVEAIRRPARSAESSSAANTSMTSASSRDSRRAGRATEDTPVTAANYESAAYLIAPFLRTLGSLSSSLAPIKGRKAVLLYAEEFSATRNIQGEFTRLVTAAREANVAFYTIDAIGLNSFDRAAGQGATDNLSIPSRSNPRGSQLDWTRFERQPMDSVLRPLAKETGGVAIYNTSEFNQRLHKVDRELSNYYVLGFEPGGANRDGKYRTLEVKCEPKAAELKHRHGYYDPRPLDTLGGSKEEALLKAVSSRTPATGLPIELRAAYFYEPSGVVRLPVAARIRAASIGLRKKGAQMGSDINIVGVAYSDDGAVAARFSQTEQILLDRQAVDNFRKQNLSYRNYFRVAPGKYRVKLVVADEQGNIGSSEQTLTIPPQSRNRLAASALIIAEHVSLLPDLLQNISDTLMEETDPLLCKGTQITMSVGNQLQVNAPFPVFFRLYNLTGAPSGWKLSSVARMTDEKGETRSLPPIPLDQNLIPVGPAEAMIGMNLVFDNMGPGKYTLTIETTEAATKQSVSVVTDVRFR